MRFGLVHRVMTDALAALGVLALVCSGQFSRIVDIVMVLGLLLAICLREPWRREAGKRHLDTISLVILIALQVGRAFLTSASFIDLLIEFAVGLQIIRVATRKGAAHDQQVVVLALLHLIAGTVVGGGLGYGLCFFALLVVTPGALVLSHLRREVEGNYRQGARDRTGLPVDVPRILRSKRVVGRQFIAVTCMLAIPILLFTAALFVIFPRVGLSLMLLNRPKSGRMIGFSGKVDLGQIGTLRSDPTIALRITMPKKKKKPPRRLVMHLRGAALDSYDGLSWSQSSKRLRTVAMAGDLVPVSGYPDATTDPVMRVELDPIEPPVLFVPPHTKGFRVAGPRRLPGVPGVSVQRGPDGEYRYHAPAARGVRYEIFLTSDEVESFRHLRPAHRPRYLQLPEDLPHRIRTLAQTWTAGRTTDYARAKAIEARLRTDYRYDLSSPSGKSEQPLDDFLFESKRGHCEYYSTAMAVMLRTLDVPTRNVTGFIGGSYNRFGQFYAVRQGDAHSWVEVYVAGRGWVTFDPTPPGAALPQSDVEGAMAFIRDLFEAVSQRWNQHVLGYDLQQQVSLFESFGSRQSTMGRLLGGSRWRIVAIGVGIALVAFCLYKIWRRRRRRASEHPLADKPLSPHAILATNLYEMLDRTMSHLGVARAAATPPLRHAENLEHSAHPLAEEILRLTRTYLAARFGDSPLSPAQRKDFEARVRRLGQTLKNQTLSAVTAPDATAPAAAADKG